jgi:hypothetical protein
VRYNETPLSCSKNKQSHFISIPRVKTNQFIQCSDRITNCILILRSTITGHGRIIYEFWDFFYIKQITYFYQIKFSCSKVCHQLQSSTEIICTLFFHQPNAKFHLLLQCTVCISRYLWSLQNPNVIVGPHFPWSTCFTKK